MTRINEACNTLEKGFNVAGSIPVVGFFSGTVRLNAGMIQAVVGAACTVFALIAQIFSSDPKWVHMAHQSLDHVIHGALNFIRGLGETVAGALILPSLVLLAVQSASENKFNPIFKYVQHVPTPIESAPKQEIKQAS